MPRDDAQSEIMAEAESLISRGENLEARGEVKEALQLYTRALDLGYSDGLAEYRTGRLLLNTGEYEAAIPNLARAASLAPDHAPTRYLLAKAYAAKDQPADAVRHALISLELDAQHSGAWLLAMRSLTAIQDWPTLLRISRQMPSSLAQSGEAAIWLAVAAVREGASAKAAEIYCRVPTKVRQRYPAVVSIVEQALHVNR